MQSSSVDRTLALPRLEGKKNYINWSVVIRKTLIGRGEWKYVDPANPSSKPPENGSDKAIEAFEMNTNKAASFILCACQQDIQRICARLDTASDLWDYLEKT